MRQLAWYLQRLSLALGVAGLSACSILPPAIPQDIYRLPSSTLTAAGGEVIDRTLRIARPAANDLLGSASIVVVPEGNRLSVYEGVRWSAPAPILWRDHLLEAFHNDGRIARAVRTEDRLRAEIELDGMLRAFQVEYRAGQPEVHIQFEAWLVDTTHRHLLASRRFAVTEAVAGRQVPAVVEAFGRAGDALAGELIEWTLTYIE